MTWGEREEKIYSVLKEKGFAAKVDEMINQYGIGGTAGEQFCIICTWLAKMRNHDKQVYEIIKGDAEEILQQGIDIKYFTKRYYDGL